MKLSWKKLNGTKYRNIDANFRIETAKVILIDLGSTSGHAFDTSATNIATIAK